MRGCNLGVYKFRRQHPVGRFIVDFYCAQTRLVIEIDGDVHAGQETYDIARAEWLQAQSYRVVRFINAEAMAELDSVARRILEVCEESAH